MDHLWWPLAWPRSALGWCWLRSCRQTHSPLWLFGSFSSSPICEDRRLLKRFPCALNASFSGAGGNAGKESCSVHRNPFCASQSFYQLLNRERGWVSWLSCLTLWYCYYCKSCQVRRCCSILSPAANTNLQSNEWGARWMQKNLPGVPPRVCKTLGSLKWLKLPVGRNRRARCLNSLNVLPTNAHSASDCLRDFYRWIN